MASSASTDPSNPETGNSSNKHAWSQIVRSKDAAPSTKKLPEEANLAQIPTIIKQPQPNQVTSQMHKNAELHVAPFQSTLDGDASVADARVFDEASVEGEEAVEAFKTVVDDNAVTADGTHNMPADSNDRDVADPRVSRPPWQKPPVVSEDDINPLPVMGATAWPALTEARNIKKTSEMRKLKGSSLKTPISAAGDSLEDPLAKVSLHSGDGPNYQQGGVKNKPFFKGGPVGIGRPAFQPIENGASLLEHPALGAHGASEQPLKQHNTHARMKGNFSASPLTNNDRPYHHRNDGAGAFQNNNRKWRNNHRDQGRVWNHHGRAYENAGDMVTLLHEQRIGPRNMPRPQPFINMNPGFYPLPHFQSMADNVSLDFQTDGGMYYVPPGAPEFAHGSPYFSPIAPPGGVIGPDAISLRSMLINQVDYYFSVENLCRDVFLRTHMDEEGFVPISVIAQFNRIRSLSSNPMVILEALQHSAVVEVQHDRIRRCNDRGKWRLVGNQVHAVNPRQESFSVRSLSVGEGDRAHDSVSVASLEEANIGSAPERTDAKGGPSLSDRLIGSDNCVELKDKKDSDDIVSARAQHIDSLGTNASMQSSFPRDGRRNENAVRGASLDDSAECQSSDLTTLHNGPEHIQGSQVAFNQTNSLSDARFLEERDLALQADVDGKPVCWKAPEGFWVENGAYLRHGGFEKDVTQPTESDFMLEMHQDGDEQHGEPTDRDLDRLINVSRTSLGSFIAVP